MYLSQAEVSRSDIVRARAAPGARIPEAAARPWAESTFLALVGRSATPEELQAITNSLRIGAWSYDDARNVMGQIAKREAALGGRPAPGAGVVTPARLGGGLDWGTWWPWIGLGGVTVVTGAVLLWPRGGGRR